MNGRSDKTLLLTQSRSLTVSECGDRFIIEELPEWLADNIGLNKNQLIGQSVSERLGNHLPGLTELLQNTREAEKSIKGYKISFDDRHGYEHKLLLDTSIKSEKEGNQIKVIIQEMPDEYLTADSLAKARFFGLIGRSKSMQKVFNKIRMYSVSDAPVLISGETGAGKEGVAQAIHNLSNRSNAPFITMNCSAITETLFESELFGHEKGSFTGAIRSHRGRFERANNGTLFLDEIGDLPSASQAKLLRVLETSQVEKVGAEKSVKVNVRVVAATNRNLEKDALENNFRPDLFYRINALQIKVPALRERPDDIEPLIQHFINLLNKKYNRSVVCLTREAIQLLKQYRWPGNIRELKNLMERLFAENQTDVIGLRSLKEWYHERQAFAQQTNAENKTNYNDVTILPYKEAIPLGLDSDDLKNAVPAEFSVPYNNNINSNFPRNGTKQSLSPEDLKKAYQIAAGNITRASEILGIHKATFYRYLKNFSLSREDLK
ncbi:MAG: sigma-54 interaction domain-containing protein [Candidatus Rifleibacteriota bacterium]